MTLRRMLKWVLLSALAAVVLCFVANAGLGIWLDYTLDLNGYRHGRAFDAAAWRAKITDKDDVLWPPRQCMIDDLMSRNLLKGMTREEVIAMLGPQNGEGAPSGSKLCDIYYLIGPNRGFGLDSDWLFLKFGPDGRLERQWVFGD